MTVKDFRELLEKERVPYPEREKLFLVLGQLLTGRISMDKATELLDLRVDELWLFLFRLVLGSRLCNKPLIHR